MKQEAHLIKRRILRRVLYNTRKEITLQEKKISDCTSFLSELKERESLLETYLESP